MAYDDVGDGDPVLLVHGHPFDRSMWAPQAAALSAAGWRVIVPDLRGYGQGPPAGRQTLLSTFAADLAGLLDRLGLDRVVVGGLSMGGQIVMDFLRQYPARVRALVLADTHPRAETAEGRAHRYAVADRLDREGMRWYADENLPRMIAPYHVTGLPEVAAHVHAMMLGAPPAGAAAAMRGRAERPDYRDLLAGVAVPTLVLVGRDDTFTPVADAEQLHRIIPGSSLTVLDRAAHLPNLEQPAAVNAALTAFLKDL
jgi:3-oxoadipate enol-lactonase